MIMGFLLKRTSRVDHARELFLLQKRTRFFLPSDPQFFCVNIIVIFLYTDK